MDPLQAIVRSSRSLSSFTRFRNEKSAPFLMSARYDANSVRIDGIDQIVGESPQGLPAHPPCDSLGSLGVNRN